MWRLEAISLEQKPNLVFFYTRELLKCSWINTFHAQPCPTILLNRTFLKTQHWVMWNFAYIDSLLFLHLISRRKNSNHEKNDERIFLYFYVFNFFVFSNVYPGLLLSIKIRQVLIVSSFQTLAIIRKFIANISCCYTIIICKQYLMIMIRGPIPNDTTVASQFFEYRIFQILRLFDFFPGPLDLR